uniref:Ras family protein n=1 Tax=Parastrongyloides trichosuri TaxID=131310 RepID=A0A0N4ZRL9_PARTI
MTIRNEFTFDRNITQSTEFSDSGIESIEEKVVKKKTLPEYKIAFIGNHSKYTFLEKLKQSSKKYEKHVKYQDVHYMNYIVNGSEIVLELFEHGTEHTGAREMAIRKAEGIILFYSAMSMESYHQLVNCVDDFKRRKKDKKSTPIYLISNEDPVSVNDYIENESSDMISSTSEGYESEDVPTQNYPINIKRKSMEKIKEFSEEALMSRIPTQEGESLAKAISSDCRYLSINVKDYDKITEFVSELILKINSSSSEKIKLMKHKENKKTLSKIVEKKMKSEKSSRNNSEKISKIKDNNQSAVCNIQ